MHEFRVRSFRPDWGGYRTLRTMCLDLPDLKTFGRMLAFLRNETLRRDSILHLSFRKRGAARRR
jgi:hypothetical protein